MPKVPEQYTPPEAEIEAQKEELQKRYNLMGDAFSILAGRVKFGSLYTRIENYLGRSTEQNSPITVSQLQMAVAISHHPAVEDLLEKIKKKEVTLENFNPEPLREAAVLQGMKILDLGCGCAPTFARTARRLGADVYTVDVIPANEFRLWNPAETKKWVEEQKMGKYEYDDTARKLLEELEETRKLEAEKHVQIDLNDSNASTIIAQRTGGNFDLVTASQLIGGFGLEYQGKKVHSPYGGSIEKLAMKLLKKGGVFFHPSEPLHRGPEIKS